MSNLTEEGSQSATEQVKDRVQDVAEQAKGQTWEQLRTQINTRSSQAGEQVVSTAGAMRTTSGQLRSEGKESVAKVVDGVAGGGERLGSYLTRADSDQILRDIEDIARRQPWLFVGGSAIAGFLASRFMKASSSNRYQARALSSSYPRPGNSGADSAGHISPPAVSIPPVLERGQSSGLTGGGTGGLD
jgi:ElaB/YqjD/DUF883 family membrane-anchored ribosome-binding protein